IIEDDLSSYWLYTRCGLLRIARTELEAWIADPKRSIQVTTFDATDGVQLVPILKGLRPAVTKASDGKIWFVNGDKVSFIDPSRIRINVLPPPVHVEQTTVDGKTYDAGQDLRLPPHVRNLVINYTALSLVAPEKVRFRVKLEGQDKDWRELVNVRHVEYTNLPPKHYKFRVLACNNNGVWNEEGASLDFVIPSAWYQTNWFRVACVAAFLAMVWGIHELRVRQLAAQFNMRLEERISERTRIARDLHDTLLQSFQGLVFRFQAARYHLPDRPEEASDALDSALVSADQAIAEGRGAIQQLRSGSSQESNLEQMLLAMGRELVASQDGEHGSPPLRVIVEGERRAKRAMLREEIYRIARELLRNAYRHARARNIEAELRYDDDAFLLIVRDDGKGIDPKVLKDHGRAGHWGLQGTYERAEGMGARLDIWSEVGAGTEVRLKVPAAIAYEKSGDSGRFKLFRKTRIYEHRS
ncbi:MAG: histidine kinase, partial [Candidatus Acidiferrum sp.]